MSAPVKITITSDFICPWCYIGEQRLTKAVESLPDAIEVEILWLPFELNPKMPTDGLDRRTYRSQKFGSWEHSCALDAATVEAARADGIGFDYAAIERTPSTFLAHRLSLFARQHGRQTAFIHAVFKAYFAEGRDIGEAHALAEIAVRCGLDARTVHAVLSGDDLSIEVRALEHFALQQGVSSVPYFMIGGKSIAGAQSAEQLRRTILDAAGCRAVGDVEHSE